VLVCVYADDSKIGKDTLIGSNYLTVAELMATGDKGERTDKKLACKLFPEAVFRGETFTDVRIHMPASASALRLPASYTANIHSIAPPLRGDTTSAYTYASTLTSRSSPPCDVSTVAL